MKRLLAVLAVLFLSAMPVQAAASIAVNEPGPYAKGDVITMTVVVPKLKGYEYPVVLIKCRNAAGDVLWTYFRRWDGGGEPSESGPEPVLLGGDPDNTSIVWNSVGGDATCTIELWAYGGLAHPHSEHLLASALDIFVTGP